MQEVLWCRLGCSTCSGEQRCQNFSASTQCYCHEPLGEFADHAAGCQYGPLRIGRHDAYADQLADCIAETGAHVRREAFVKAFSNAQSEAWLDIWAFSGVNIQDLLIDVSIRHPMAGAYQPAAARNDAAAAQAGEKDKWARYPASGGRAMTPFVVETWGRMGPSAEALLESLAAEATRHARRRGQEATANAFLRRWRASLDACLQRGLAQALHAARHGLPGRAHRKTWLR